MARTLILIKKKDHVIPEAYLSKVLAEYPTAIGAASVDSGAVWVSKGKGPVDLDAFKKIVEDMKDRRVIFSFTKNNSEIQPDDMQPFSILRRPDAKDTDDGMSEHSLVAFVNGSFPNFEKTGSTTPPEAFMAREHITDLFMEWCEKNDDDLDKVFENLKTPNAHTKMLIAAVGDVQMTIVGANDKVFSFERGNPLISFDWGTVNDALGYADKPPVVQAPVKPARVGLFQRGTPKQTAAEKPPAPIAAPPTATKVPDAAGLPAGVTVDASGVYWARCPMKNPTRQQARDWYEKHAGFKPDGYKDCPNVKLDRKNTQIEGLRLVEQPAAVPEASKATGPKVPPIASTEPIKQPVVETVGESSIQPVMTDDQKLAVMQFMDQDFIKKTIGSNGQLMVNPQEIPTFEGKLLTFEEQTNVKLSDTIGLTYQHLVDMARNWSIEALAIYALDWRRKALNMEKKLNEITTKKSEPAKQAEPAPTTAPAPAQQPTKRKSIFARSA